jgi:hypothetical protein
MSPFNEGPIVDLINRRFDDLRQDLISIRAELKAEMIRQDQRITELEKIHWKVAGGVTLAVLVVQLLYDKLIAS